MATRSHGIISLVMYSRGVAIAAVQSEARTRGEGRCIEEGRRAVSVCSKHVASPDCPWPSCCCCCCAETAPPTSCLRGARGLLDGMCAPAPRPDCVPLFACSSWKRAGIARFARCCSGTPRTFVHVYARKFIVMLYYAFIYRYDYKASRCGLSSD